MRLARNGDDEERARMRVGLHISDFTWDGGPAGLRTRLGEVAQQAEQAGVDRISVMDHVWQIGHLGPPEHEMLEAYTTLGWLAAKTERVKLLTVVTAVVYRDPGLLAKAVTTLDVLSGGRAMLGIGAAWNEEEALGLGLFFPPLAERFERLEEALRICLQMWSGDDGPFDGSHYHLGRTLNSPQSLSRPHPPILIGGAGEKKTLRLVARYADACNIFDSPELAHKLDVLREHCAREGRDYAEIEKTVQTRFDLGEHGEKVNQTIEHLHELAELGIQVAHGTLIGAGSLHPLELMAGQVIPAAGKF
jgi:F420-dependent oxidoreductase-like protein